MAASGRARTRLASAFIAVVLTCGLAACQRAVPETPPPDSGPGAGARAFADTLIEHNRTAFYLAAVAEQRGERPETRDLAAQMVSSRVRENQRLGSLLARLRPEDPGGEPPPPADLSPTSLALAELGVPARMLGLPPPPGFAVRAGALDLADPFDRSFIDTVIPLNRGAIALAEAGLRVGDDAEAEGLARSIITTRVCEIQSLNGWRRRRHGLRSPAGGVPTSARRAVPGPLNCP